MKKRWWVGGLVVGLGVLGVAGWWFGGRDGQNPFGAARAASAPGGKAPVALEFVPAEITQPTRAALIQRIEFSGPLVAPGSAVVRAKAAGRLVQLAVAEGSRVKAGQVLGTLDLADQTSRVAERAALVESARAALAQAERTHAQNERLSAQQFISAAALDGSRAAVQTARAQLDAAQAALNTSRVGLRDSTLTTPLAGIVAKRHVLPGEMLSPEQQVLTIVDLTRLELAGAVATHEVARLAPGHAVEVTVEGHAQAVTGRISRIAPAAEPGTRAIGVTIEIANPGEKFRAGQYALAAVTLADEVQRLVLPVSAVGTASGQSHVWTIADGKLMRRAVMLGRRDERGGRVEIVDGVAPDTQVLAARFDNLREGSPAKVVAGRAAPLAGAASAAATAAPR